MKELFKKDPVLWISGILALLSCLFVTPDREYWGYINFRVLAILFCLMLVVGALVRIGTFEYLTCKLLSRIRTARFISLFLVVMSFFLSMLLTNDVTLVTLVPFAIMVLKDFRDNNLIKFTLILTTVAANLGSMMTPIGNPQNIYLYTKYAFTPGSFIMLMLPYAALSLALTAGGVFVLCRNNTKADSSRKAPSLPKVPLLVLYCMLFVMCILTVAGIIPALLMFIVVSAVIFVTDKKSFLRVDRSLLITFVFFFILTGNLGRIPAICDMLSKIISWEPVLTSVIASQAMSNVPAAMLLSAFTDNGRALVIGTNLGGLGTLIASMASLITYKYYSNLSEDNKGGKYVPAFTVINVIFLLILFVFYLLIG